MKTFRSAFPVAISVLLFAGYLASVYASFTGQQAEYGAKVDQPPIVALALVVLILGVVFAFVREKDEPT